MDATMNIVIRVNSRQAAAAVQGMESNMRRLSRATAGAATAGNQFGRIFRAGYLERFSKNLQWTGRQLEYNFTLPLLLAAGASTKWAMDNERAMVRVRKVYGDLSMTQKQVKSETDALAGAFRALSDTFGVAQDEVIGIAAAWAQAGASGIALAKVTRQTMELMILGEMEAAEATEALIAIQAQYGLSTKQLTQAVAMLNVIENQTAVSLQDLTAAMQRSAGVARSAGVNIRHLGALVASLVPAAGSATQAGNALRTMISRIMAPTNEAADLFGEIGININKADWNSKGFIGRLFQMREALDGATQAQKQQFGSIVASRWQVSRFEILLRDITNAQGYYRTALEATRTEQGKTLEQQKYMIQYQNELRTVLESSPQAFSILTQQLKNLMVEVFMPLIPVILGVFSRITNLVRKFSELSRETQTYILIGLLFIAVLGPILRYIGAIGLAAATLLPVIHAVGGAFKWLGGMIWASLGPWGLLIAGILALMWVFRDEIANTVNWVLDNWSQLPTLMVNYFAGAIGAIISMWNMLPEGVANALSAVVEIVHSAARSVMDALSFIFSPISRGGSGTITKRATGGIIPGSGRGDIVPALLEPGEFVIRRAAVKAHGRGVFERMNRVGRDRLTRGIDGVQRFANGGVVKDFRQVTSGARTAAENKVNAELRATIVKAAPGAGDEFDALTKFIKNLEDRLVALNTKITTQQTLVDAWKAKVDSLNATLQTAQDRLADAQARVDHWADSVAHAQETINRLSSTPITGMQAMSDKMFANEQAQKALRLEMLKLEQTHGPIEDTQQKLADLAGELEMLRGDRESLRLAGAGSDVLATIDSQIAALEAAERNLSAGGGSGPAAEMAEMQKQMDELQRQGEMLDLQNSLKFDPLTRQIDQAANAMKEMPFGRIMRGIAAAQENQARYNEQLEIANGALDRQQAAVDRATAARDAAVTRLEAEQAALDALNDRYSHLQDVLSNAKSALDDFTSSLAAAEAAKARAAGAGASPAVERFRAAGDAEDYVVPGGTGGILREGGPGDQSKMIQELADKWAEDSKQFFGNFDLFKPIRDKWAAFKERASGWWQDIQVYWDRFLMVFDSSGATEAIGGVFEKVRNGFSAIGEWLAGIFNHKHFKLAREIWRRIVDAAKSAFDFFVPIVSSVVDDIVGFIEKLVSNVQDEWKNWSGLVDGVKQAFSNIFIIIGAAVVAIMTVLRPIINFILYVFGEVWPSIQSIIRRVWDVIVAIIRGAMQIIRGIIEIFVGIFTGSFQKIHEGVVTILNALWDMVFAVVRNAIGAVGDILQGLWDIVKSIFVRIWHGVQEIWHRIYDAILWRVTDGFRIVVKWFKMIPERVRAFFSQTLENVRAIWDNIRDAISARIVAIRDGIVARLKGIRAYWAAIWDILRDKVGAVWTTIREWISARVAAVRDRIVAIVTAIRTRWAGIWDAIRDKVGAVWTTIREWIGARVSAARDRIVAVVDAIRTRWARIWDAIRDKVGGVWDTIKTWVSTRFGAVRDRIAEIIDNVRTRWTNFWDGLRTKASNIFTAIADRVAAVKARIVGVFQNLRDGVGRIWDGLKSKLATPINWVISNVYNKGIVALWNKIATKVGMGKLGEMGLLEFARGGRVPGQGDRDTVPAMLTPGEYVLRKDVVKKLGVDKLEQLNRYGQVIDTHFASGGYVTHNGDPLIPIGQELEKMGARISEHPFWNGGRAITGGHSSGSQHYSGDAIDVNYGPGGENATEKAFMDNRAVPWIKENVQGVYQMLWRVADHFNHLHLGMDEGAGGIGAPQGIIEVFKRVWNDLKTALLESGGFVGMIREAIVGIAQDAVKWAVEHLPFGGQLADIIGLYAGGVVNNPTMAMIGERGPEAVVPMDVLLRKIAYRDSQMVMQGSSTKTEYHFHGDLSFPNIRTAEDAEGFITNLETLVGDTAA